MSVLSPHFYKAVTAFYDGLNTDQQRLLKFFVALFDDASPSNLSKRLTAAGLSRKDGKRYTVDDCKDLFRQIENAELGFPSYGTNLWMTPELISGVAELVSEEESFSSYTLRLYGSSNRRSRFGDAHTAQLRRKYALAFAYYWDADDAQLYDHLIVETIHGNRMTLEAPQLEFIEYPFSTVRFEQLPDIHVKALVPEVHNTQAFCATYNPEWKRYLQERSDPKLAAMLADMHLLNGDFQAASALADTLCAANGKLRKIEGSLLRGAIAFLSGDQEAAAAHVELGIRTKGSAIKVSLASEALVALFLATREEPQFKKALAGMGPKKRSRHPEPILELLQSLDKSQRAGEPFDVVDYQLDRAGQLSELGQVVILHVWLWQGARHTKPIKEFALKLLDYCRRQEAPLLQALTLSILKHLKAKPQQGSTSDTLPQVAPILPLKKRLEAWEKKLVELERFALTKRPQSASNAPAKTSRLIWEVNTSNASAYIRELVPKEQLSRKNGGWSQGRAVSLARLRENADSLPFVAPQDLPVIQHIRPSSWNPSQYHLDVDDALHGLVGHPHVYREGNHDIPLDIIAQSLKFILSEEDSGDVTLTVQPGLETLDFNEEGMTYWWDTPTRLCTLRTSPEEVHLIGVLGLAREDVKIPAAGKDRLLSVIQALKEEVSVYTDVADAGDVAMTVLESNLTLQLHLAPHGEGLRAALRVQPIKDAETYLSPGSGSQVVFAEANGQPCKTQRSLAEELAQASEILEACPSLSDNDESEPFQWSLPEPLDCLELLTEIHALGDRVDTHWPQGERFKLMGEATSRQVRLKVTSTKDWFQLTGELDVGEGQVIELQALLDLLEKDDSLGRFIKLRDGQFLALTREFKQRLEDLEAYSIEGKKGGRQINPLAAHALTELTEEAQSKLTKKWIDHVKRLHDASDSQADLPSTLQAELRPYQLDGFQWLARQAQWGVGACLADDMGLGKTLQALAILLHRATLGPALVIAPTSVTRNWLSESLRFAPTLRTHLFGPGNRAETLKDLGPFDLVLCTYGLLPNEILSLEKISWSTIVLDEAQAIKNAATQRWKAATRLQGDYKVITTGTPIENHLGELHALFQFINPGLLGSGQRFHVKFADPISKQRDFGAQARLKRLIRPFILRRLKNQVLQDLPPRTDIVLRVEPSKEEVAFYEALRRKAVKNLTKSKDDGNAGERSLRILAEIMKLRRACCHPKLVDSKIPLGSSKLELFAQTLEDVLSNQHKALVFSQFVDHLGFIRDHLDKANISYQYLDGSTPAKKRQQAVDAFQRGEDDVFLISLRAGGTGLNLTAADYVIHMDPWWNPAVEDQASDRAHRIGQQRPVTVYRLVVANTIEEKIVNLHHQKRDLADSLLSGTETAGKLSPEQLLDLLKDER